MNAKLVAKRYRILLAFIDKRACDGNENALHSLARIVQHAARDEGWLRWQGRPRKRKP